MGEELDVRVMSCCGYTRMLCLAPPSPCAPSALRVSAALRWFAVGAMSTAAAGNTGSALALPPENTQQEQHPSVGSCPETQLALLCNTAEESADLALCAEEQGSGLCVQMNRGREEKGDATAALVGGQTAVGREEC